MEIKENSFKLRPFLRVLHFVEEFLKEVLLKWRTTCFVVIVFQIASKKSIKKELSGLYVRKYCV